MKQNIINSIEDIQSTVKVNSSLNFDVLAPYLDDAYDRYLVPYVGEPLLERITSNRTLTKEEITLMLLTQRVLGPLALAMASPELGVMIGDSGHTVTRNDKYTVANDEKIQRSESGMMERGFDNLDRMLVYLEKYQTILTEWQECEYFKRKEGQLFLKNAMEFQDYGYVDIHYSSLTFDSFRPLLHSLTRKMEKILGDTVYDLLVAELKTPTGDSVKTGLISLCRMWLACSVAKLYTSKTTREQRAQAGTVEFRPVIYPLYDDQEQNGNYYQEEIKSLESDINAGIQVNAEAFGITAYSYDDFNSKDKHIFII